MCESGSPQAPGLSAPHPCWCYLLLEAINWTPANVLWILQLNWLLMCVCLCVCGKRKGDWERQPGLLFPDMFPWPDFPFSHQHPLLLKAPPPPPWDHTRDTSKEEKTDEHDFLSRKYLANQPPRWLLAANAVRIDSRVLTAILASLKNTVKILQQGGKPIPFQQQEKSLKA